MLFYRLRTDSKTVMCVLVLMPITFKRFSMPFKPRFVWNAEGARGNTLGLILPLSKSLNAVDLTDRRLSATLYRDALVKCGTCIKQPSKLLVSSIVCIERLIVIFRWRLCLPRRNRSLAQQPETLTAGLFITGCFYNLCDTQHSLHLRLLVGTFGHRWVQLPRPLPVFQTIFGQPMNY